MSNERGRRRRRKRNDGPPVAKNHVDSPVISPTSSPPTNESSSADDGITFVRNNTEGRPPNDVASVVERAGAFREGNDDDDVDVRGGRGNHRNSGRWEDVQLSKSLSWALRHAGPSVGLNVGKDGYASVDDLLSLDHPRFACKGSGRPRYTVEDVRRVVENNDKRRFRLEYKKERDDRDDLDDDGDGDANIKPPSSSSSSTRDASTSNDASARNDDDDEDDDGTANMPGGGDAGTRVNERRVLCIRANQGHSLRWMKEDMMLSPLDAMELSHPDTCIIHGTTRVAWEDHIRHEGLSRMGRNHIHFATGLPLTAPSSSSCDDNGDREEGGAYEGGGKKRVDRVVPISGMRSSSEVYIYVNGPRCAADGIQFYRSDNGVILTAGLSGGGMLPLRYIAKVVHAPTGKILWSGSDSHEIV
ncbi:hypothetical protein ACHAXA_006890 [Cyclostephanos tholiformis]|uniref:2'-phosphotransferase n=1 Tax=Cyclostephanos tholiformis TaxID=382380 RepID=A0ABD3SDC6_9STRA